MISELDVVVLTTELPEYGLRAGDEGTVVHAFGGGAAYLVEFTTPEGDTIDVIEVQPDQIRRYADCARGVAPASLPSSFREGA